MSNSQTNLRRMLQAVLESLIKHESDYAGDVGLSGSRDRLAAFLAQVDAAAKMQKLVTKGLSNTCRLRQKALVAEFLSLCSALFSRGEEIGDAHLMDISDWKSAVLNKMRKPELIQLVGGICDKADLILADLAAHGFGNVEMASIRTRLADYTVAVYAHRAAVNEKAAATATIKAVMSLMRKLVRKNSDNQLKKYEASAPHFFVAYTSARKIVDLGIRHKTEPADLIKTGTPGNGTEVTPA